MSERHAASFPAQNHDHSACLSEALWRAKSRCDALGIKWTGLREQVFRHVATSHKPVSAYDLIESLAKEGKRLAPVSVYRILNVLQSAGLVHRLESRNAYFACMTDHPSLPQTITFVCDECDRVAEVDAPDAIRAIGRTTQSGHFHARNTTVEVSGVCAECQSTAGPRAHAE
jgi:Fur family zinc uptake transcriptional regulator